MIQITIDSFKNQDSLVIYELPEGTSVKALKAEIEATDNITTDKQRLAHNKRELHDEEVVDAFNYETIYLTKARLHFHISFGPNVSLNSDATTYEKEVVEVFVDLDGPTLADFWSVCDGIEVFTLNSQGQYRSLSELGQPFSFYGIKNGDTVHMRIVEKQNTTLSMESDSRLDFILYFLKDSFSDDDELKSQRHSTREALNYSNIGALPLELNVTGSPTRTVKARYTWDGNMNHSGIKGLPLKPNASFHIVSENGDNWLFGIPVREKKSKYSLGAWFGCHRDRSHSHSPEFGYIPKDYVCYGPNEDGSIIKDVSEIPPLPPFLFPPARGLSFDVPIGDHGHSFLTISANYEFSSCPTDPTHVTIKLLSATHHTRRISGISLLITMDPDNCLTNIQTQENAIPEEPTHTDQKVTTTKSKEGQISGFNIGVGGTSIGIQGGVLSTYSVENAEKGSKTYRKEISAGLRGGSMIFWDLKASVTNLDEKGLQGEENISFVVARKPERFKYNCRITHAKDGVEKKFRRVSKE